MEAANPNPAQRKPTVIGGKVADWMMCTDVMDFLGITRPAVEKLGDARVLTRRVIPGCAPRYLRSDVERLAERSTTLATDYLADLPKSA